SQRFIELGTIQARARRGPPRSVTVAKVDQIYWNGPIKQPVRGASPTPDPFTVQLPLAYPAFGRLAATRCRCPPPPASPGPPTCGGRDGPPPPASPGTPRRRGGEIAASGLKVESAQCFQRPAAVVVEQDHAAAAIDAVEDVLRAGPSPVERVN